ncbi:hypothetical protein Neosp_010887 [[Neocosmospora] mangrovei]
MPKSTSIPKQPLYSVIKGGLREHMFDVAHDALDSVEAAIIRLRNLEAFILDMMNDPQNEYPNLSFGIKNTAYYMSQFQVAENLVDKALFGYDSSLMDVTKVDNSIGEIAGYIETDISRLEGYIMSTLGKLPDEIPSGKIRGQRDVLNQEVANLYGSSELPSLVASFESKSEDQVSEQAKDVLKTLQSLLDRAKSLALECIPCNAECFNGWEAGGLGELLDRADHILLLQLYTGHFRHDGQAITKFMAGKFDRSATRLDYLLRAYILAYKDIPKKSTPIKLGVPSLEAAYKGMYLQEMRTQNWENIIALKSLQRKHHNVRARTPLMAAAHDLEDRADIGGIEMRRIMAKSLRKRVDDLCCYVLGDDFIKNVFWIFYCLIRADIGTFEKLISDVEMLGSR